MTMDLRAWDRRPDETEKSWAAFQIYRDMPVYGADGETRSLANVQAKLGHSATGTLSLWSAKYNWVDRVAAHDAWMGSQMMTAKEVSLQDYQQAVVADMSLKTMAIGQIIDLKIKEVREDLVIGKPVEAIEIKRLVSAAKDLDDLRRRLAGMPTTYTSDQGDSRTSDDDDMKWVIGG